MAYYSILVVDTRLTLSGVAADNREDAIAEFGAKLDKRLTLVDQGIPAPYLLDEWFEPEPHWVDHHIPVFELPV